MKRDRDTRGAAIVSAALVGIAGFVCLPGPAAANSLRSQCEAGLRFDMAIQALDTADRGATAFAATVVTGTLTLADGRTVDNPLRVTFPLEREGSGDPEAGRKLTGLLAAAGFTGIAAHAEADADTGDAARARDYMLRILGDPDLAALARRRGWATPAQIALSADAWADWATRPDAFAAFFWCTAAATKPAGGL